MEEEDEEGIGKVDESESGFRSNLAERGNEIQWRKRYFPRETGLLFFLLLSNHRTLSLLCMLYSPLLSLFDV